MRHSLSRWAVGLGLALGFMAQASAHYLWIEAQENEHRLYYGEVQEGLREKSPGKLDAFAKLVAREFNAGGADGAVQVAPAAEYFILRAPAGTPQVVATDENQPVRDLGKYGLGMAKSNYYAKFLATPLQAQAAGTALDMVPVAGKPRQFQVLFRGQPLAGAKVEVVAPNTWVQEHQSGNDGRVRINTPWKGRYTLHVLHVDKQAGEFGGARYDNLRNHMTLTFDQSEGADPGPAVAPQKPE